MSYNSQPPTLWRVQCDMPASGTPTVQAFFKTTLVNTEAPFETVEVPGYTDVSFELPAELAAQIVALAQAALAAKNAQ